MANPLKKDQIEDFISESAQNALDGKINITEKGAANGVATLGADSKIPLAQIPSSALERMKVVADQAARFALTTDPTTGVQNGDCVKENDTQDIWVVTDDANLNSNLGYEPYNIGTAASVPWSGVTGKPTTTVNKILKATSTTGDYADSGIRDTGTSIQNSLNNGCYTDLKGGGQFDVSTVSNNSGGAFASVANGVVKAYYYWVNNFVQIQGVIGTGFKVVVDNALVALTIFPNNNTVIGATDDNGARFRVAGGTTELDGFKYGKAIYTPGIDWDNLDYSGFFRGEGTTNNPLADTGTWFVSVQSEVNGGGLFFQQTATSSGYLNTANRVFTRCKVNGVLGAWEELVKQPLGKKIYKALISQTGTSKPSATIVLENTIGTIVWTRDGSPGRYLGTLTGGFKANKTIVFATNGSFAPCAFSATTLSDNEILLLTTNWSTGAGDDDMLNGTSISIEVYL